jgi:non-heme chloroperoxidase
VEEAGMANKKKAPVVFIHGLWLHALSWQPWVDLFNERGYEAIAPAWPGDGDTVEDSREHPETIANRGIKEVTDHFAEIIKSFGTKPIVIGHSFGGLIVQELLSENLAVAGVAIDPTMPKGVFYIPPRQLASVLPVLSNPAQLHGANSLDKETFHNIFANAVSQEESDKLHDLWTIPAPGRPLFQAATANLQPHSEAKLDVNAKRGPLLITGGEKDKTVPEITSKNIYKLYRNSPSKTDYVSFKNRGHSLIVDSGWKEIADYTLKWLEDQAL